MTADSDHTLPPIPAANTAVVKGYSAWPRRVARAAGTFFLTAGVLCVQVSVAAQAWADRTVSIYEVCNNYKPGYMPTVPWWGGVLCLPMGTVDVFPREGSEGVVKPGNIPGLPNGSHRVNPDDPFSDWVVPSS